MVDGYYGRKPTREEQIAEQQLALADVELANQLLESNESKPTYEDLRLQLIKSQEDLASAQSMIGELQRLIETKKAQPESNPQALPSHWTIEPHGRGYVLYSGRDNMHHGMNLVYLSEPDANWESTKKLIEAVPKLLATLRDIAANPTVSPTWAIAAKTLEELGL
jgi:hypothetical protein